MNEKILIVDDEPNVLFSLKRLLSNEFSVDTANCGQAGLKLLAQSGPFAVVVSDMRMPGMNGVQFLTAVRAHWPETVRLVLTGDADIRTAVDAVNEGSVFRFLTKPCPDDVLKSGLKAALTQHELIVAEKELLEKTLHGTVKILTEILAVVNPAAFSRASRVHRTVKHIVECLGLRNPWRYEVAAMLSQIGCVVFDTETVEAVYAGAELSAAEQERFKMHPSVAFELLSRIPRLDVIAGMIAGQESPPPGNARLPSSPSMELVEMGAQLLKIAVDFDQFLLRGIPAMEALGILKSRPLEYDPVAVASLESLSIDSISAITQEISVREMSVGMILDQDLRSTSGMLMVARNQEITFPLLVRIRNLHQKSPIYGRVRVKIPQCTPAPKMDTQDQAVLKF